MERNVNEQVTLVISNIPKQCEIFEVLKEISKRFTNKVNVIKNWKEQKPSSDHFKTFNVEVSLNSEGIFTEF